MSLESGRGKNWKTREIGKDALVAELGRRGLAVKAQPVGKRQTGPLLVHAQDGEKKCPVVFKVVSTGDFQIFNVEQYIVLNVKEIQPGVYHQATADVRDDLDGELIFVIIKLGEHGEANRFFILLQSQLQDIILKRHNNYLNKHSGIRPEKTKSVHLRIPIENLTEFEDDWALITNCVEMERWRFMADTDIQEIQYAGFWIRVGAAIIDIIIMNIVGGVLGFLFGLAMESEPVGFLISFIVNVGYFAGFESSSWQATLGKRAVGVKVTGEQGERISFWRAVGRYLGKIVSTLILFIGFLMVGWTKRKQGLHDMMAGTLVVKAR